MIQFLLGLAAGLVVGLVMEWVIDWRALLPGPPSRTGSRPKRQPSAANTAGASTTTGSSKESVTNPETTASAAPDQFPYAAPDNSALKD